MEEPASPLVLTKLRVPAARPRLISRGRLLDRFTPGLGAGLILVCAPAGYGKTTVLQEWAQALIKNGTGVAWYALDPSDDDPLPLRAYFVASFIEALGPIPALTQVAQQLRASTEMDLQRVLPEVINAVALSGRECVLILDDYHLVASLAIHNAMAYLLEHRPENLRIAIGSRSDPPLPLARLRARGQLLEIRTADLRFTPGEAEQFLNEVMRLQLSPQGIEELEQRTEGWVAGLQLAALSLSGRADKEQMIASFSGSHRYLVEYLMEEVVNRQPPEVQAFLHATSILERMCAPLCDAVLGTASQSESILRQLEQTNLFVVALDDQQNWYRYHHLFRDFLQTRLNKTRPEAASALHRTACEWLAAHAYLREAAQHAFLVGDWEYAAAFAEQHGFTLIIHSDIATIYEWSAVIPEAVMQKHPLLCLQQCLALAYGLRRQNRARIEARLQQVDQVILTLEGRPAPRELTDLAAVVRTFLAFDPDPAANPREVLTRAQGMLSNYSKSDAGQFSGLLLTGYAYLALSDTRAARQAFETALQIAQHEGLYFGVVESSFHLARLALSQGELRRAAEICHQTQAELAAVLADPGRELPALGCLDIALGGVLLEQDRLDEAEEHLRGGLALIGHGSNPYYLMTAYLALYRLNEIRGRPDEAMTCLNQLEAVWPDVAFCTRGLRATYFLRSAPEDASRLAKAAAWCQDFTASFDENANLPGLGPFGAAEAYYVAWLTWIRAQIALGKVRGVASFLARQANLAAAAGLSNRLIELSLLEAQAWRAAGEEQRAWPTLERALAAAEPAGYVRIFDQGPALAHLLAEAARRGLFKEYLGRILGAIGLPEAPRPDRAAPGGTSYVESLSERELEVLRLIAQGATNQEIASKLVITVGTVKSHINHVLDKLGAHNRTEAVARARAMGLLDI